MALQGNIETFALPDVLRLLASTSKTGRLRLEGSRGEGSVWVLSGALVAGTSSGTGEAGPTEVLFELLRFPDGDFVFDQDEEHAAAGDAVEVEAALAEAESMLVEWHELESVVPSLSAWLSLTAELPEDTLTVDRAQWRSVATIAGGTSVEGLATLLELGELAILRLVRDLLALGVVEVGEPRSTASSPAAAPERFTPIEIEDEPILSSVPPVEADVFTPFDADESGLPPLVAFDPLTEPVVAAGDMGGPAPLGDDAGFPAFDTGGLLADEERSAPAPGAHDEDPADAAEIARQLANLSPKAAKAVAAAAKATTDEEREQALAGLDGEDTSLNRDLLLKFLGSVNS